MSAAISFVLDNEIHRIDFNKNAFLSPTTTVLIALGLVKGSINVSGGSFCHVA